MDQLIKRLSFVALLLFSSSVMLATIFRNEDKATVIALNDGMSAGNDELWLALTDSAAIFAYGAVGIGLIWALITKVKETRTRCYVMILSGIISPLLANLIKYAVRKPRPFHPLMMVHPYGPHGGWSYPSGHTTDAFFLLTALVLIFPKQPKLLLVAGIWAVSVGLSRVYLGAHYPSDVIAGMAVGCASAILAARIVRPVALRN